MKIKIITLPDVNPQLISHEISDLPWKWPRGTWHQTFWKRAPETELGAKWAVKWFRELKARLSASSFSMMHICTLPDWKKSMWGKHIMQSWYNCLITYSKDFECRVISCCFHCFHHMQKVSKLMFMNSITFQISIWPPNNKIFRYAKMKKRKIQWGHRP